MMTDNQYMAMALHLADKQLGLVAPNPVVGCVLVKYGAIVGQGVTARGGRPHAETEALKNAKVSPQDATMYVTLEPCCHQGVTGPCTAEIIKARVRRVVVAIEDPDPRVSGGGITTLRNAGIQVEVGLMREEAEKLNIGFFTSRRLQRPYITCKLATTLDGKIAAKSGDSKWITGEDTREWVHDLRAKYDGVMVGSNTLVADDPLLTVRVSGMEDRTPVRLVVDSEGRLKEKHKLAKTAEKIQTWVVTCRSVTSPVNHVRYLIVEPNPEGRVSLKDMASRLVDKVGLTRLLVEGGGGLVTALLKEGLIDRLVLCRSGKVLGNDAVPSVGGLDISTIGKSYRFKKAEVKEFSEDVVEIWDRIT